ncbi:EAL domain-containing protein [Sphingomonas humi]|uniref:EAL domain-containing protein n=1 Tax=Sphingomonas humi TaxID=335630 RepID=A0ABP7RZM7_9SPHN
MFGSLARQFDNKQSTAEALLLMQAFERSSQGWFWSVDDAGCLVYVSESVATLLDMSQRDLIGQRFTDIFMISGDDDSGRRNLPFLLTKCSPFEGVILRPVRSGLEKFWAVSGDPHFDRAGNLRGFRGSAIDITDQRRSSERASRLAEYDALTGLPNRRKMEESLDAILAGAEQHRRNCVVMLVDLDRFKQVNDTLGHPAGDALLRQVAGRLMTIVGDKERVFRLGGDEFQVIVSDRADQHSVEALASDIIHSLSQPYSVNGSRCVIGASIGIAVSPKDGFKRVELIRNADLALYASKFDGRGRFKFFSTDLLASAEEKRVLEEDLRDALVRNQMRLVYQPVVHCHSNRITGVEALMRWDHPTKGPISPAVFVPIAEDTGLVSHLGDWALRKACEDAASWPGSIRVAVNVSPAQFTDGTLPSTIISALASSGLPANRLELEITEGVFLGDTAVAAHMFATLKKIGVRLALDDFGTGYSSLGYLRSAPFDKIKIDQTFVREATLPGSRNSAIIAAIVALAEALGMDTTAEGIEFLDQLALIRRLGVSHVQGWVYSKALTSADLQDRLADGKWAIEPTGPSNQRSNRQSIYRKAGVLLDNTYRSGIIRNLSDTGALIEGIDGVPANSMIIVDLGDGQLAFAKVVRAVGRQLGVQFDTPLEDDGTGTLCTRRRVSAYTVATLGLPKPGDPDRVLPSVEKDETLEQLGQRLGLTPPLSAESQPARAAAPGPATFRDLSREYLDSISGDEHAVEAAEEALTQHFLPRFGQRSADKLGWNEVGKYVTSLAAERSPGLGEEDVEQLRKLTARMWALAVDMQLVKADEIPVGNEQVFGRRSQGYAPISIDESRQLLAAALASPNRQLKYIMAVLMLTGARTSEVLAMRWSDLDLAEGTWRIPLPGGNGHRDHRLTASAVAVLGGLARLGDCPYVLPNLSTRKPYRTLTQSWDVVKMRANLGHLELDDLRDCTFGEQAWLTEMAPLLA